ncbi:hypothetical protein OESDEN_03037 [Oesophagostomum dentatum]|uniref:KIF-binding protein n=1 Tax=Oesophagostomum dentatum TaxID=61180 RepID=A0A0B1TIA9_OESDE|nr:hypothetical protein OESDEN_03037 [Oesophagostomum dentatum]
MANEGELFTLLRFPREGDERRISHLRQVLREHYISYETLLEDARPMTTTPTILAHRILLADAFFFHARIEESENVQRKLYQRSIEVYSDLLDHAKRSLPSTDDSLLSIIEKISQLLRESRVQNSGLVLELITLLDRAEADMSSRPDLEKQRKIRRIRENIDALGSYYYLYF